MILISDAYDEGMSENSTPKQVGQVVTHECGWSCIAKDEREAKERLRYHLIQIHNHQESTHHGMY